MDSAKGGFDYLTAISLSKSRSVGRPYELNSFMTVAEVGDGSYGFDGTLW